MRRWWLAGLELGSVTTLVFRAVPAPPTTTNVHLAWPYAHAGTVIGAWQRWAPTGPDELAASLARASDQARSTPSSVPESRGRFGAARGT